MWIYLHLLSRTSQGVLVVKNQPANAGDVRVWVLSLDQEDTLQEGMTTIPEFLPVESHGRGTWRATISRVAMNWNWLSMVAAAAPEHVHTSRAPGWNLLIWKLCAFSSETVFGNISLIMFYLFSLLETSVNQKLDPPGCII